jgi:hypothetical protein
VQHCHLGLEGDTLELSIIKLFLDILSHKTGQIKQINKDRLYLSDVIQAIRPTLTSNHISYRILSGAPNTQSARSGIERRQPKIPSSYQLHHLVFRHLSQVVKNSPCSGFEPGTSRTKVSHSNYYTIELYCREYYRGYLQFNNILYKEKINSKCKINCTA